MIWMKIIINLFNSHFTKIYNSKLKWNLSFSAIFELNYSRYPLSWIFNLHLINGLNYTHDVLILQIIIVGIYNIYFNVVFQPFC